MFCTNHAPHTNNDEGDGKDLSHINGECGLESFLNLFGIFDEEAEGEDIGEAEAEVPASANLLGHLLVQIPHDEEENGVGNGLIELSWMTGEHIHTLKDESPGHISNLTDNLRVHQVTQTDEAGGCSCGDGDIVEYRPDTQFGLLHIQP